MKIFVSGRIHDQQNIQTVIKELKAAGHEIIFDWTIYGNLKPYDKNSNQSRVFAQDVIQAISEADVFIVVSHPEVAGGSSAELGAAIMQCVRTGKPRIYMVGQYNTSVVFYFHPSIHKMSSMKDVMTDLKKCV